MNRILKLGDIANLNNQTFKNDELPLILKYLDTGNLTKNKIDCLQYSLVPFFGTFRSITPKYKYFITWQIFVRNILFGIIHLIFNIFVYNYINIILMYCSSRHAWNVRFFIS